MSKLNKGSHFGAESSGLRFSPLPFAVRLDSLIPAGQRGPIPASKLTWVSWGRKRRWTAAFGVLLLPN